MRGLSDPIHGAVFISSRERATFQSIVEAAKEADLLESEYYLDVRDKRPCTFGYFSSDSSEGRGSFRIGCYFQHRRPVHAGIHASKGIHIVRGPYSIGQSSQGS